MCPEENPQKHPPPTPDLIQPIRSAGMVMIHVVPPTQILVKVHLCTHNLDSTVRDREREVCGTCARSSGGRGQADDVTACLHPVREHLDNTRHPAPAPLFQFFVPVTPSTPAYNLMSQWSRLPPRARAWDDGPFNY